MKATIIVSGLVQGVGYRHFTAVKARQYKLKGYVRNLPDGCVEIVAQGEKGLILDFLKELQIGPVGSKVTNVSCEMSEKDELFQGFNLRF